MRNILDSKGGRNSVYPPSEGLTFFPFIYMVPQYRPDDVLMLGYAGGTTAGLIRMFYGQAVPIVAVDIQPSLTNVYNVTFIQDDAREYIKYCGHKFDSVIIDMYEDGSDVPCDFVTQLSFVTKVKEISRYIIVHAKKDTDMTVYGDPLKVLALNDSRFYYYMVERIGRLPIR